MRTVNSSGTSSQTEPSASSSCTSAPEEPGPEGGSPNPIPPMSSISAAEFTVLEGPYARRKLWQNLTFGGGKVNEKGQSIGGEITRSTLRAMLESSRNIQPSDMSEKAVAARRVNGFEEFDGIVFAAKIGIEKGKDNYPDKNKIAAVITPDKKEYQQAMNGGGGHVPAAAPQTPSWAAGQAPPQAQTGSQAPQWASAPQQPPPQAGNQTPPKTTVPSWAQ